MLDLTINSFFEEVKNIEQKYSCKYIIIGDTIRKYLEKKIFNNVLYDDIGNDHFDVIVEFNFSSKIPEMIKDLNFSKKRFAYHTILFDNPLELVGYYDQNNFLDIRGNISAFRPDSTIERIGFYSDFQKYDEFNIGFSDFENKILRINPLTNPTNLWLDKLFKLIQLKTQLELSIEQTSYNLMNEFIANLNISELNYAHEDLNQMLTIIYSRTNNPLSVTEFMTEELDKNLMNVFDKHELNIFDFE